MIDRKSIFSYCTFVRGNLISWRSKKQSVVAQLNAEREFQAMAHEFCKMLWIHGFLRELGFHSHSPMQLYYYSKAAISIAHNPVQHDRMKHVEIDKHFIKEKLQTNQICILFVKIGDQLANAFTKRMCNPSFSRIICKLGMHNIYNI